MIRAIRKFLSLLDVGVSAPANGQPFIWDNTLQKVVQPPPVTGNVLSPRFSLVNDSSVGVLTGINVKSAPYNAAGNGRVLTDGTMANGSAVLTSASAPFVPGDVGKRVVVNAHSFSDGPVPLRLYTTITGYTSATTVTLAVPAAVAYTGVAVIYGSDSTAAIQAAINDAITTNRRVFVPGGTYLMGQIQVTASIQIEGEHAGMHYLNQLSSVGLAFIGVSLVSMNGGNILRLTGKPHYFGIRRLHFSGGQPLLFDQLDEDCEHTQIKDVVFENAVSWCIDVVPNGFGYGEPYQFEWENIAVTNCANGLRLWLSPCSAINGIYFQGLPKGAFGIDCHSGDLTLNRFNGGGNSVAAYDGLPNTGACIRLHNTTCIINGSKFENYVGSAIKLDNTASLKLNGCDFRDVPGQPAIANQQIAVEFTSASDRILVVQSCLFTSDSAWKDGTPIHQTAGSDLYVPPILLIDTPNTVDYGGIPSIKLSTGGYQSLSSVTVSRDPFNPISYIRIPHLVTDKFMVSGLIDSGVAADVALHWLSGKALGRDGPGMNTYFDGGNVFFREGNGAQGGSVHFTGAVIFPNDRWLTSTDGAERLYFADGSGTYLNGVNSLFFRVNDGDVADINTVRVNLAIPVVAPNLTEPHGITFEMSDASVLTAGIYGTVRMPVAGTITKWTLVSTDPANGAPLAGSVTVEIKKGTLAQWAAGTHASMTGAGTKPALASASNAESAPASWTTTTVAVDDVLEFSITGVPAAVKRAMLVLYVKKS